MVEVAAISDGVLVTGPEVCFGTESDADAFASSAGGSALAGTNTIGKHYTATGFSGSSITIVGTTCGGGVWFATGFWNNNIESSHHYCGAVPTTFYDSSNCSTGSYTVYVQAASLGWMNNRASCVRYG